ncbi:glutathione S-transferase family protein [Enterovirga aerilata]|uniref:Glutathione S-transferase family protein n=1 Tax=Enterovirga aerilata TaxID=2730920 RepID=A0A849I076_9HYPH|nr:glutathione S-transferase family protein [Enterovirga sp. DB1703]NNM72742.1 glutathione S-transferase family protein [Enterovirga sp. DB1703]
MITLHHCVGTRSFRPLWALEELELPYDLKVMPFPPRARAPGYLELNPLGTVPLLVDGATRMTESAAICHYLATRDGRSELAVAPGEPDYAAYLNWLHFGEATLTFPQAIVLRYSRMEPPERRLPQAAEDYARWFGARLRAVSERISGRDWLAGDRFTMADISVGYALMLADESGLSARFSPPIQAYRERLRSRPAYRRAGAAELRAAAEQGVADTAIAPSA